jgi:hypothetical protein
LFDAKPPHDPALIRDPARLEMTLPSVFLSLTRLVQRQ